MVLEQRTRVTVIFPHPTNQDQFRALQASLDEFVSICGGVTTSTFPDWDKKDEVSFLGRWLDPETEEVLNEPAILMIADALFSLEDVDFMENLETVKIKLQREFNQRVIWMTVHRLDRIASHDYV